MWGHAESHATVVEVRVCNSPQQTLKHTCSLTASAEGRRKSGDEYRKRSTACLKSRVSWMRLGDAFKLGMPKKDFFMAHVSAFLLATGSPTCTANSIGTGLRIGCTR